MTKMAIRYLFGNIVYSAAQFVIVCLLIKFGSPANVGQYALGLAVTAPIFMFSHLNLRSVLIVDVAGRYEFGDFLGLRMITTIGAFLVTSIIVLMGSFDGASALTIFVVSLFRIIESISDMLLGICQKNERFDTISVSRVAKGTGSILVFALIFIPTHSLTLSLLIMNLLWLGIMLGYDWRQARKYASLLPVFEWNRLLPLLKRSAPLGIVLALMSLNTNIPQYAIAHFLGEHELGVYASLAYLIVACNVVVTALGESITPRLADWFARSLYRPFLQLLSRMIGIGLGLGLAACLVGGLFGKQLLTLIYSQDIGDETRLFGWLLASTLLVFIASFLWYGITATGEFTAQVPLFLSIVVCHAAASWLFVSHYGLSGAAAGTILALLVQTIGSLLVFYYVFDKRRSTDAAPNSSGGTFART